MTKPGSPRLRRLRSRLLLATFLGAAQLALPAAAADILNVRVGRHPDMTRLVIDLDGPATFAVRYDAELRLVIEIEGEGALQLPRTASGGVISGIDLADPASRRLAVKLAAPAEVTRAFRLLPESEADAPYRLVFDMREVPRAEWARLVATDGAKPAAPLLGNLAAARPVPTTPPATPTAQDHAARADEPPAESPPAPEPERSPAPEQAPPPPPATPPARAREEEQAPRLAMDGAYASGLFDGLSIDGYVEVEGRWFPERSEEPEPKPGRLSASVAIEPSISYAWNDGRSLLSFTPFARLDSEDGERTHFDIRELKWVGAFDRLELRLGIDKVFWGVVESQHLVDIINQDDMLEDIDGEDKLGQPMAALSYDSDFGLFSAYVMTGFRKRQYPGRDGRPRGPLPVAIDLARFGSGRDRWDPDWAIRWSHILGPVDLALSHFHGTNRDPRLVPGFDGQGAPVLIPHYDVIDQTGLEFQGTFGPWLLKAEAIRRAQPGENQYAAIAGFEYTAYQLFGGRSDLGIIAEYLWDERKDPADNPFEDDLFVALRWTANDVASTTLLVGTFFDLDSKAKFVNIEASRRIAAAWRVALDARLFFGVPDDDPLLFFRDDSFIQLKLQRFF